MNMTPQEYQQYVKQKAPKSPLLKDTVLAFVVGGAICVVGQLILNGWTAAGLEEKTAGTATSCTLVFLSALLTGLVFRKSGHSTARQDVLRSFPCQAISLAGAFAEAMRTALNGTLAVCASVVLFYVLATPFRALGGLTGAALTGTVELFSLVPLLSPDRAGFILAAACAGWGGFSVLFQTIAVLEGSGLHPVSCLKGKLVQSLFSGLLAAAVSFLL